MERNSYIKLVKVIGINWLIMFALTYVLVFSFNDVFLNLNRFYMSTVMVMPMVVLMVVIMRTMFQNKTLNFALIFGSMLVFASTLWFIRSQSFIDNEGFLRSMIPHHSGAITMCKRSNLTDQEIIELCNQIVETQKEEISQMRNILNRLNR